MKRNRVIQTLRIEEDEEETTITDEDTITPLQRRKHKVHSNFEQPIPTSHIEPVPTIFFPSPQQPNIVHPPSNFAPIIPPTYNSTLDEIFEATLVEHFASLGYKTHHLSIPLPKKLRQVFLT